MFTFFILIWFLNYMDVCVPVQSCQSCLTLCNPMDCSLTGFSVHGILQARTLEWVAIPSSRASSQPKEGIILSISSGNQSRILLKSYTKYTFRVIPSEVFIPTPCCQSGEKEVSTPQPSGWWKARQSRVPGLQLAGGCWASCPEMEGRPGIRVDHQPHVLWHSGILRQHHEPTGSKMPSSPGTIISLDLYPQCPAPLQLRANSVICAQWMNIQNHSAKTQAEGVTALALSRLPSTAAPVPKTLPYPGTLAYLLRQPFQCSPKGRMLKCAQESWLQRPLISDFVEM